MRALSASLRASWLAEAQWGVIGDGQLKGCALDRHAIARWRARGRLHLLLPAVFALGHKAIPVEGWLTAALIYAGRGAVLSHRTAAWWWGLIPDQPELIDVSTTARPRSTGPVLVHHPKELDATRHHRLPVTTVPRTLLDYAKTASDRTIRSALSEAEYRGLLNPRDIREILGQGRAGSNRLSKALTEYEPLHAVSQTELEVLLIDLCKDEGIPLPEMQVEIAGLTVDAFWREERVAVELDGYRGHRTRARFERDRARDLRLRRVHVLPIRYTHHQLTRERKQVAEDLKSALAERRGKLRLSGS